MRIFVLSLLIALALSSLTAAQSEFYYYDTDGSPIYLNVFDTLVAVRFSPEHGGSAQAYAIENPLLADEAEIEFIGNRTYIFRVEDGISLSQALSTLRWEEEVTIVNPVAHNRFGDRWKMSNQLLVVYPQELPQATIDSVEQAVGLERVEMISDSLRIVVLEINQVTPHDITKVARDYFQTGFCQSAEPVITLRAYPASNDPFYTHQYQLENVGQEGGTIDADIDWNESNHYNGPILTWPIVALIDAGFTQTHEDLAANWYAHPFDAIGPISQISPPDYAPWPECDGQLDLCWHGTTVLGVLKAAVDNATGIAGVETRPYVMPVKIIDNSRNTNSAAIARGLDWARRWHGGASTGVICITWLFPDHQTPANNAILKSCYDGGIPVVVSTGNFGEVEYPANSPYVLAVGYTNRNDQFVPGSGVGPSLDVVAPGEDIWTLDLMGEAGLSSAANNCGGSANYACGISGSSYAAPLVAGTIAKMLIAKPNLLGPQQNRDSAEVVYEILRRSADRAPYGVSGYQRVNDLVGWGRLNANKAVLAVKHGDADNNAQRNISDAVYLITYIFGGGPAPVPEQLTGDCDCNGIVTISDAVYMITWVFGGGPEPGICAF